MYDNSSEKDKGFALRGEGVPLPPRLQREALDPKHRAWVPCTMQFGML